MDGTSDKPGGLPSIGLKGPNGPLLIGASARPVAVSVSPESRQAVTTEEMAKAKIFRGVALDRLSKLLGECRVRRLEPEGLLIRPYEVDATIYVVLRGRLRVHLAALDDDPIAFVEAGESVGELSIIDDSPRSAYVVADQDTTLLAIDHASFWNLASTTPEVPVNLLHILAGRMRDNNTAVFESRRLQELYKRHASIDALTGLNNRRWLDEVLPRQLKRSEMQNDPTCVIMIDIDHFKTFNDQNGHQAGDFVLFAVAHLLKQRFRPTDLLARYGGEEFTAVLPETDLDGAQAAGERVREAIRQAKLVMPEQVSLPSVSVSMGVAQLQHGEGTYSLLQRADRALYEAKRHGRNCVRIATVDAKPD